MGGDVANDGGSYLHLRPIAVQIRQDGVADGICLIDDPTRQRLLQLGGIALAIAAICRIMILLVQRMTK